MNSRKIEEVAGRGRLKFLQTGQEPDDAILEDIRAVGLVVNVGECSVHAAGESFQAAAGRSEQFIRGAAIAGLPTLNVLLKASRIQGRIGHGSDSATDSDCD